MADFESWNELCDLYLLEHDYTKAAFCMEECIMGNPHNHAYYQKYAEVGVTGNNQKGSIVLSTPSLQENFYLL